MKKYLSLLMLMMISVSGCSQTPIIQTQVVQDPVIQPNLPPAVNLQSVTINVYDKNDIQAIKDKNVILFTLTPTEYQKLQSNINEMNRYILQEKGVIMYYIQQYQPYSTKSKLSKKSS